MTTNTTAALLAALEDADCAINSMKVEAETAAQGDEQMMLEACEQISNEGLAASWAIRAILSTAAAQPPAGWMPIETAPKDGTRVILSWGCKAINGFYLDNSATDHPWQGWRTESMVPRPAGNPDAWQPFPRVSPEEIAAVPKVPPMNWNAGNAGTTPGYFTEEIANSISIEDATGYEHQHAIMEAERNDSLEQYQKGAGLLGDTGIRIYEAGFGNGWNRALAAAPKAEPAQPDLEDAQCRCEPSDWVPPNGYDGDGSVDALARSAQPAGEYPPLPEPLEIDWPELHSHALGCGVEDRGLRDRYECAEYGWQDGVDKAVECVPDELYDADQMRAYADATCAMRAQAARAAVVGPLNELEELNLLNRLIELGAKAAHAHAQSNSDDGHAGTNAYVQWQELRAEMGDLIRAAYTAPTTQAAPPPAAQQGKPSAYALKWPNVLRINLSTVFDTEAEAQAYLKRCTPGVVMVPLYANPAAPVVQGDALIDAARFASDVLAEVYTKYQVKIGPFASQAQLANVRLRDALKGAARSQAKEGGAA